MTWQLDRLAFDRTAFDDGAWWQLLTAQWVHFGWQHAAMNALAATVTLLAFRGLVPGRVQWVALLGGIAGVALVLVLDTACLYYAGASGALHGLLAGCGLGLVLNAPRRAAPLTMAAPPRASARSLGYMVLVGLTIKLLLQRWKGDPFAAGWLAVPTYYPAHEAGAVGGMLAVLLLHWVAAQRVAHAGGSQ